MGQLPIGASIKRAAMTSPKQNLLGQIPAVEILLRDAEAEGWTAAIPRRILLDAVRAAADQARQRLLA
jgi:hypothetical protein